MTAQFQPIPLRTRPLAHSARASADGTSRILGIALAVAVTCGFWMGALTYLLPVFGVTPSSNLLLVLALLIGGFIAMVVVAVGSSDSAADDDGFGAGDCGVGD